MVMVMNIKNDLIVILTLLNLKRKEIQENLTHMKKTSLNMLKYFDDNTIMNHRLFDEFTKIGLLTIFNTPYPDWNNRENYTTHHTVIETALQHLINNNIKINIYGDLVCQKCTKNDIINKLLTFNTIIEIHNFIAKEYPLLTHLIATQMTNPQTQQHYGVKKPINFTTFIMKKEYEKIIPKEQLKLINSTL